MLGISLTAEQVRAAPPEVRQWLQEQLAGLFAPEPAEHPRHEARRLAALTTNEAGALLEHIEDVLPVVSVFFEMGRENASAAANGMRVFRLGDMARHTRLQSAEQVLECLEMLNEALRQLRRDPEAMICMVDPEGRCFVAEATSHAVRALWQSIVASRALETPARPAAERSFPIAQAN